MTEIAIVVPHVHWDREWYAPFETMRFHLVRFFDELIDTLETEPDLPVFLLDGQAVVLADYLEIRPGQRDRLTALVEAGRLRPGPFYVQPDEFHVSGEALVRNLLIGCRVAGEFGWVMREGYLPDTFGHVHQLPQILRGFGIETLYAMRGFGPGVRESQFHWRGPDGSRVLVEWLTESYSNAAVLTGDPATMELRHGALVRYDSLPELLTRLAACSPTGVLLLLNGGDHLRVQHGAPGMVRSLDAGVRTEVRLGGLEEFSRLVAERADRISTVDVGELRYGRRHDVFDGIASTRTPMKLHAEAAEARVSIAERLDALATVLDGRTAGDALRHAWRELVKNHAHDSICGCSVDEVHAEMTTRFTKVEQLAAAVTEDALDRIGAYVTAEPDPRVVPVVVVNPSGFARGGPVTAEVVADLAAPLGQRLFGWTPGPGADWSGYVLRDPAGAVVPGTITAGTQVRVVDALDRRKEVVPDRLTFTVAAVPPLSAVVYTLEPGSARAEPVPDSESPTVSIEPDGTLTVTAHGRVLTGLCELVDAGDAGDEYGFGPIHDTPVSSRSVEWTVDGTVLRGALTVPKRLAGDRRTRSADLVELSVELEVGVVADVVTVAVTVDNRAEDHRLRLRIPTGVASADSLAESAFGVVRRPNRQPDGTGWLEPPSGAMPMRRFVAVEDEAFGVQVLTEGLHEYQHTGDVLDVTLLRAVGRLATMDHPARDHKIGPELSTPDAQCPGRHTFRIGIRPFVPARGHGGLYRAAEEFTAPLLAHAVQGVPRRASADGPLGLEAGPADVVVSAVKVAEDDRGLVVRVFNASPEPVTATLGPRFPVAGAWACDLVEHDTEALPVDAGAIHFPLPAAGIATVRLTTDL